MDFVAIDVETANADMASICQIGVAIFKNGKLFDEWSTLVNPKTHFSVINVGIHGIEEEDVDDAPSFCEIAPRLHELLHNKVVVIHTHFDRVAIQQASAHNGIDIPNCQWLDTARVARRTWNEFSQRGYGLANICMKIGYEFNHHDALEDAKASGEILLAASKLAELDLEGWLKRVGQPINPSCSSAAPLRRDGNPDGMLSGEVIVFTGRLDITKQEAADMAARVGCDVGQSVTRKTTILCVGDQDIQQLAGHTKSSKHRKAEDLITKGQPIRIIRQADFMKMVSIQQ